ncbi:hypothetical protein QQS21_011750 [Conoideocrella luteorostrata]|uniref:N-acetyl-D-glucosamine kinase n=1 Tax=Conoideocrella luteorostrata TaxID=1105319 RepID=A0AAJ0CEU6_9HYPO|nr:hypothetical protein QQS21_011750 [Conoideocrella luteorostrata]
MTVPVPVQLAGLQTELRNPRTTTIDRVSTEQLCRIFHREDSRVPAAVEPCIPVIAQTIDVLSERVRSGGRVFYIGAGTSGRLGVLDASEIPPTYSASSDQFVALIAGGDHALRHAKEGAEDSRPGAEADLKARHFDPQVDSLIGIASSGRTPYVLGGLHYVRSIGGVTVGLVCTEPSAVGSEGNADFLIAAVTGPEVVTGSTRMKAGTATKLVLNMISSGIMIRLGKTYGNLMVDLRATNIKLQHRARNIIRFIGGPSCTHSDDELDEVLQACRGSVKLAAAAVFLNVPVAEAEQRLHRNRGVLAKVFEEHERQKVANGEMLDDDGLVLCVDAGGTSCKAVVMSKDGVSGSGVAGPCNVSSVGLDAAVTAISEAIQEATDNCPVTRGRKFPSITFEAAWVGIAGNDRPALATSIHNAVSELVKLPPGKKPKVTTDVDLLSASASTEPGVDSAIVLVSGTGSVAMSFKRAGEGFERTARVGGWGHLLGDDGSGYGIGREAIRNALREIDVLRMSPGSAALSPLSKAILQQFTGQNPDPGPDPAARPEDLLSAVVAPDSTLHQAEGAGLAATKRIAGAAKVVLSLAATDDEARKIVDSGTASLAQLVMALVKGQCQGQGQDQGGIDTSSCGLVLAGGLMQDDLFREALVDAVTREVGLFAHTCCVSQPAVDGAKSLLAQRK